ncbi:hypothetical protein C8R43DRAFT_1003975 [Mycena crocata]|nr:hypothetical protein C8R43DRAFT_1003975 [Mycena crocata]
MLGQILIQANPPADPSLLSDSIHQLSVQLNTKSYLSSDELKAIKMFRRVADYIAAGHPGHFPFRSPVVLRPYFFLCFHCQQVPSFLCPSFRADSFRVVYALQTVSSCVAWPAYPSLPRLCLYRAAPHM